MNDTDHSDGPTEAPGPASRAPERDEAGPPGAPPARSGGQAGRRRGLRGQEAIDAIRKAQGKARRAPAPRKPAAKAAPPVAAPGAGSAATARCLRGCDWTAGPGDPGEIDRAAAKHTKAGHPTTIAAGPRIRGAA